MNSLMKQFEWLFRESIKMRGEMLDALSDDNLRFSPGGDAMTLGALCREMGEIQHAYTLSVSTGKQEFTYRSPEAGLDTSVQKLRDWYTTLDAEFLRVLGNLSEADLEKPIDRGPEAYVSLRTNAMIFHEAELIFFGKASIYFKALGKPLPGQWPQWIG